MSKAKKSNMEYTDNALATADIVDENGDLVAAFEYMQTLNTETGKSTLRLELSTADSRGRLSSSYGRIAPLRIVQWLTDCDVDVALHRLEAIRDAAADAGSALQDLNAPKKAVKPSRTDRGTAAAVQAWTAAVGDRVNVSKVVDADQGLSMDGLYIRSIEIEEDDRVVCLLAPKATGKQPKAYSDCWYSAEDLTRYTAPKTSSRLRR